MTRASSSVGASRRTRNAAHSRVTSSLGPAIEPDRSMTSEFQRRSGAFFGSRWSLQLEHAVDGVLGLNGEQLVLEADVRVHEGALRGRLKDRRSP